MSVEQGPRRPKRTHRLLAPSGSVAPAERSPGLTLEQLRAAEQRARDRVQADRPGDRDLALRALRQVSSRIRNLIQITEKTT
jgi:hypothetical protein